MKRFLTIGALAVGLVLPSCSGDEDDTKSTPAPPEEVETPNGGATSPGDASQLPPRFLKCMAEQGFEVKSPADIHSAPPEVLQACFGSIH